MIEFIASCWESKVANTNQLLAGKKKDQATLFLILGCLLSWNEDSQQEHW